MTKHEFDRYATSYEDLLRDPIRNIFGGGRSDFFHLRKANLIRDYFQERGIDTRRLRYLDLGCGKGDLLSLLREDFDCVCGCDLSTEMLSCVQAIETRVQEDPLKIPFGSAEFDLVTAVCVFHHVPPAGRLALTREASRVLKPGGVLAVMEHNPYNPIARIIVSRTPVDADAILLKPSETCHWMVSADLLLQASYYFLFLPAAIFRRVGRLERWLTKVPLGGQYAVFGTKKGDV
jgi:SAM-dependent methyltransferase